MHVCASVPLAWSATSLDGVKPMVQRRWSDGVIKYSAMVHRRSAVQLTRHDGDEAASSSTDRGGLSAPGWCAVRSITGGALAHATGSGSATSPAVVAVQEDDCNRCCADRAVRIGRKPWTLAWPASLVGLGDGVADDLVADPARQAASQLRYNQPLRITQDDADLQAAIEQFIILCWRSSGPKCSRPPVVSGRSVDGNDSNQSNLDPDRLPVGVTFMSPVDRQPVDHQQTAAVFGCGQPPENR